MSSFSTAFGGANSQILHKGREKAASHKGRETQRALDIQESRGLLLELALYEPGVQQCVNLITNFCLSEKIEIRSKNRRMTDDFSRFVNQHYISFASEAIRCFFMYGFVAWHPRKLPSGDIVPSLVPHGMFTWGVMTAEQANSRSSRFRARDNCVLGGRYSDRRDSDRRDGQGSSTSGNAKEEDKNRNGSKDEDAKKNENVSIKKDTKRHGPSLPVGRWDHLPLPEYESEGKQLHYVVELINCDIEPEDVFIFEVFPPNMNVSINSSLSATVHSPLSHILVDYKNLRDALIRRAHADAWNTTARVFTACQPPPQTSNEPTQSYLYYETGSASNRINTGRGYMENRYAELERQITQPSNHVPCLYNLPIHHNIEQLAELKPCEDTAFLLEKYRRDICNIIGVPFDMVFGRMGSASQSGSAQADVAGRMFTNTVYRVCKFIEHLLQEVYSIIYDTDIHEVNVSLNPMPRLDIRSIEDIKILWEMGAVTPDVMAQLSEVLLISEKTGSTGKKRETTHAPGAYLTNLKEINKAQQPPKPLAPSAGKKKKKKKTASSSKKKK